MRRNYSASVLKTLFAYSGNTCAFSSPETGVACEEKLTDPSWAKVKARICHIRGLNSGSARHDPTLTESEANGFDNLLLMCPNHHAEVDDLTPELFPVDVLERMKERNAQAGARTQEWAAESELERYASLLAPGYDGAPSLDSPEGQRHPWPYDVVLRGWTDSSGSTTRRARVAVFADDEEQMVVNVGVSYSALSVLNALEETVTSVLGEYAVEFVESLLTDSDWASAHTAEEFVEDITPYRESALQELRRRLGS